MTNRTARLFAAAGAAALIWGAGGSAYAADAETDARIAALEAQLAALQAQIADLKESSAADVQAIRDEQHATTVSIANGKPTIASGEGAFSATLHAVMQLDTAQYLQDDDLPGTVIGRDLNNGTNFRRGRLGLDGKIFRDFDYSVLLDFGGSGSDGQTTLHELWIQYSAFKPFKFRVGAFAPNLGLEDAASTNGSLFPERPSSAEVARSLAGADKRIAAQALANGDHWLVAAAVTGAKAADGATFDEQLGYTFRVAGTPLYGYDWRWHIGANASTVVTPAQTAAGAVQTVSLSDRPELRVDGTQLVSTGALAADSARHFGLESALQWKKLLIQGEYFDYAVDRPGALSDPNFNGWYLEGGYVLAGGPRKYNTGAAAFDAPVVENPFDRAAGKWGAWEVVGRYSVLDLNDAGVLGGEQAIWSGGVNWFVNSAVRFSLHYLDVDVDRTNSVNAQLGQSYQAINLRSQFAF